MMNEDKPDLFGKIDALLGRRAPDALLDKERDFEDFPLLTEVVDSDRPAGEAPSAQDRRLQDRRMADRRENDRRLGDRRQEGRRAGDLSPGSAPPPLPSDMSAEMERLVATMEQRLTDMFIRQQLRMEEAVRKAIRDEMGKHLGERD